MNPDIQASLNQIAEADRKKARPRIDPIFYRVARSRAIAEIFLYRTLTIGLSLTALILVLMLGRGAIVQSKLLVQEIFAGEVR